ncbi:MAG: acyl-CoA dehydrogenase family protein [Lachnospiraceae bacterium]|nr:acyl-CoA dehydrogenase family protein [Lachnospiraceae bacterium]
MCFQTTKEHETLRMQVRAFAEKEIKPIAFMLDQENAFPLEQVKMLGEMGLMGITFPKEYGGAGLDYLSYAIAVEELARVDGGSGVILSAHASLGAWPIYAYGTEEQKEKYLVPLADGSKIGAFGLTETNAGSDAMGTETTADPDGDYYILNGGKIFITNADYADIYVVTAVTQPGMGSRGISAFILEKGWEGFTFGEHYDKLGIRSSSTAELVFNNVKVPKENLLGKEGEGFRIAMATLDGGRIGIAAQALGIAQGAFEEALKYAKERVQFGKPIAYNQAISFKLADMATKLRAARLMVYSSAELKQKGQPHGMEAAMAKQYASDLGLEIVNDALQIHGGAGFMKGMAVERFYRDAKICTIYEGTNEILRAVISGYIIGRPPKEAAMKSKKSGPVTGVRKKMILKDGTLKERVAQLVAYLKADGYDFTIGLDAETPIALASRVVCAGKGIGPIENMALIKDLAYQAGAAIGCSRPVAETQRYLPLNRYIGMSGQKFTGNLYIGVGVSGAGQHLKGIKTASTIVAINNSANAQIFKNCDYGIVGDFTEVLPLLIETLDNGEPKKEMPQPKKIKRAVPKKLPPSYKLYICSGCAYEYVQDLGDPEADILAGTPFAMLPDEWICPECGDEKENFIEV